MKHIHDEILKFNNIMDEASAKIMRDGTPEEKQNIEELKAMPAYKLYQKVSEGISNILKQEDVQHLIYQISAPSFDASHQDIQLPIMKLIVSVALQSSLNAILEYDNMLKSDLQKHDDELHEVIMNLVADVEGIKLAIEHFKKNLPKEESK